MIKFSELNDSQKQSLAGKLVDRFPFRLQNTVVEYILQTSIEDHEAPFNYEDITNNDYYGNIEINGSWWQLTEEERDEKLEFYQYLLEKAEAIQGSFAETEPTSGTRQQWDEWNQRDDKLISTARRFEDICDNLENMEFDEQHEIYQWFEADRYILNRLEERDECILDGTYWGRTCYGQSIVLDVVIQKIAYDYFTPYNEEYLTTEFVASL